MNRFLIAVCLLFSSIGCGSAPAPMGESVSVSGKVSDAAGKPVGDVVINFQPLENGFMRTIPVKADGSFSVETQPGKYAYFFTPKTGSKAVPPAASKYAEASLDRTVDINPGQPLDIKLP
ncbi:MAG: carboxypeptidase regulatory-like domain-containing protein [Pirellulaceae bacterium]|nr:carboxypeptidase regulatory-like domain-containing protein [Pirellulaceae bacterium]